jgi:hypothetical protein
MDHGEFLKFNRNTVIHSSNGEARIAPSGALRVLLPPPSPDPSLFVPKLVGAEGGSTGFAVVVGCEESNARSLREGEVN